jgi:hypothetical protein
MIIIRHGSDQKAALTDVLGIPASTLPRYRFLDHTLYILHLGTLHICYDDAHAKLFFDLFNSCNWEAVCLMRHDETATAHSRVSMKCVTPFVSINGALALFYT